MAQLTVLISSTDSDFRAHVTKCLRASGTSVALVDDRHASANPPSLAIADIRQGARTDTIERLRSSHPTATIFAIASSAQPEQILQAMRAGANEYLAWPIDHSFAAAIHRAAERSRPKDGTRNSCVLSFFGVKGGGRNDDHRGQQRHRNRPHIEETDAHHRSAPVHRRGRALSGRAAALHAGRRARQPAPHRRRVPARAGRKAQDRP